MTPTPPAHHPLWPQPPSHHAPKPPQPGSPLLITPSENPTTNPPHSPAFNFSPSLRPSSAFTTTSWIALASSIGAFLIGLFNASTLTSPEKLLLFFALLFSLLSAVSLQKAIRDQLEGIPCSDAFRNVSRIGLACALCGSAYGIYNLDLTSSEKGFYFLSNLFALFATVTVQKNQLDIANTYKNPPEIQINAAAALTRTSSPLHSYALRLPST